MLFNEIPGQEEIKDRLIRSVLLNRVSHAQLFTGGDGTMKLQMAVAYARFLCCSNRYIPQGEEEQVDACGSCPSCLKFNHLAHPDLHFVFPTISTGSGTRVTSDHFLPQWRNLWQNTRGFFGFAEWLAALEAENKQPIIPVEECNQIIRKLSYKSYESEYKVMIIWLPEKMNVQAAPRILKILEEPPDKTLFILVSEDTTQMLSTILSRTQTLRFPRIPRSSIATWLEANGTDTEMAKRAAFLSEGNALKALALTRETDLVNFERFIKWLRLCFKPQQTMNDLIAHCEELASLGREAQKEFLGYGLRTLRQSFYTGQTGTNPLYKNEESEFINNFMPFVHTGNIAAYDALFNEGILHIERNGNPKIIFLDTALKLVKLIRQKQ